METNDKFVERSQMERIALTNIIPELFKGREISFYFTPDDGYDIYDAYVMEFDKITKSIIGRWIIELKVRDRFYPELMLEKKKYNDLKNKSNESDSKIIYISVTPTGSYCYNLSKIINDSIEWIKEDHWKSTTDKSLGKIKKSLVYLSTDISKKIEYTNLDVYKQFSNNKIKDKVKDNMIEHKKNFCLFRDVLNK